MGQHACKQLIVTNGLFDFGRITQFGVGPQGLEGERNELYFEVGLTDF